MFLEIHKAYDTLDWYRCVEIPVVYRVRPRAPRLLSTYWGQLTMLAKAGVYYVPPFKGYRGVNQGDPLSPTIFNLVVEAITPHWVKGVRKREREDKYSACFSSSKSPLLFSTILS